ERWPHSGLAGIDSSPEMIAAARSENPAIDWQVGEIAAWAAASGPAYDVVFTNAALQWVPDHAAVIPQLLSRVAPGGALAIQVPTNAAAPVPTLPGSLAGSGAWRNRFPASGVRTWHVHEPAFYYDLCAGLRARVDLWETEYLQVMPSAAAILEWYK